MTQKEYEQEVGKIIHDYHLKQQEDTGWVLPVFKHVDQIVELNKRFSQELAN